MRNEYVDLCLNIQATRRHFEAVRTPLAPAIGVGAYMYTHQLANVLRVLTDVRVRHLLADEVGLGKTVQALMILNALRFQRRDLKALIIVPDRLMSQWRDEILTRAHTAPFDESDGVEGNQYIRLAWEGQLTLTDIDPSQYSMLIVDELHSLPSQLQDRIVRVAAVFEHLLVLTATPAFQRFDRHAQLFALLEPERTALARWQEAKSSLGVKAQLVVADDLSKWPDWATQAVVDEIIDRDRTAAASGEEASMSATAMAHCAYRRVIRTRRLDYSDVLPRRSHTPLVVKPLGAEADRQSLMWEYFGYLDDLSRRFDPVLLAKRVILSPPSLEQRVDYFRRMGHERGGLLERVKPLVHRSQGDSRADALVDLLADIWSNDTLERVLVAAQDNLTVDYLYELVQSRLSMIGPLQHRIPLVAARVRQGMMTEAPEDLGAFGNATDENLEAFQRGEAQVLFAPEAAQVGLNLQCARVLVLYSVPWRPEEVEQWIGRLDRIGNEAAFAKNNEASAIDVYTIVQQGLVDEKVVAVLEHFHVFERSVNLDGDHLAEVTRRIEDAALRPDSVSWRELEEATEIMAEEDEVQELESLLRPHLPWTIQWAKEERRRLDALPLAPPVLIKLSEHSASGTRGWERAFEGMVKLLRKAGEYHFRLNTDPNTGSKFQTLWYRFGEPGMYGIREVLSRVIFTFGADPAHEHHPRYAHAFITRRGDIGTPPRRSVTLDLGQIQVERPLRFLSFGDALHDELVEGWLPAGSGTATLDVKFFEDHAIWEQGTPGYYLIRVSILDPAAALVGRGVDERAINAVVQAARRSEDERLLALIQPFSYSIRLALEADVRWLRALLTATISLDVRRRQEDHWVIADPQEATALFNPMAHGHHGLPRADELYLEKPIAAAAAEELNRQRKTDKTAASSAWSHRFPEFRRELKARLLVVQEEWRDSIALATEELGRAQNVLERALERGNRGQITRAENERDAAADKLSMVEVFWQQRSLWLRECEQEIRSVRPSEYLTALLRASKVP